MDAPTGRRTRWRRRASFALLATAWAMLFAAPAFAEEGEDPSSPPADVPSTGAPAEDPTTAEPATQAPPTPVHLFKMTVGTVALGDGYWQGDGSAELVISIKNTGEHVGRDTVTGFYAFPSGAAATEAFGTGGCAALNGSLSFSCTLPEQGLGQVVVKVDVDPGAWRTIATGLVTAAIGAQQRTAPIAFSFTRPPTSGIDLSASVPALPAVTAPQDGVAQLSVRLRNTGAARAAGAVEVVTPPGVDLVAFPGACRSHRRLAADRDRCDLGDIAAGKDVSAVFELTVSAAARAELPLTGAVHGYLTPPGRDTIETRYDFEITAPPAGADAPLPTSAPASPAAPPALGDLSLRQQSSGSGGRPSGLPYIGGITGLVALAGALVVLSLRRRMRDGVEDDPLPADEVEDVVLVPAQRGGEPLRATPVPRALTLSRLPAGPVAGPGFRDRGAPRREQEAD